MILPKMLAAKGNPVPAVVVDRAGEVIMAMRADGAAPHTMENARRKAYTALSFRTSASEYAKRCADNNPVVRQQVTLPSVIAIPGGLPVKVGGDVIAGVGASGSPGVDEPKSPVLDIAHFLVFVGKDVVKPFSPPPPIGFGVLHGEYRPQQQVTGGRNVGFA